MRFHTDARARDAPAQFAELNALTQKAMERYGAEQELKRYRDHVAEVLTALDGLIERTREIDRLRAARAKPGKPKDHSELVADIERRLVHVRGLLTDS